MTVADVRCERCGTLGSPVEVHKARLLDGSIHVLCRNCHDTIDYQMKIVRDSISCPSCRSPTLTIYRETIHDLLEKKTIPLKCTSCMMSFHARLETHGARQRVVTSP